MLLKNYLLKPYKIAFSFVKGLNSSVFFIIFADESYNYFQ